MDNLYPNDPGFKVGGTSEAAAESMSVSAPTLRLWAYVILRNRGPLTSDEIAEAAHVTPFSMRPRLTELKALGMVECVGKRKNTSGRYANIYRAIQNGRL